MLGETAFHNGFYDIIIAIATISIIIVPLDYSLSAWIGETRRRSWRLPTINVIAALGLLALCAIPWAHYNVEHPLSDRIYEARQLVAPEWPVYEPTDLRAYEFDTEIWSCDVGACDGDPMNTDSIYRHRDLGISVRFVVYSDCMSPEFNISTADAIDANMAWFDGDRRRTERAFFDREGRFIGPNFKWFDTPLMRSNLTDAERRSTDTSFEVTINELASWYRDYDEIKGLPTWSDWSTISTMIMSGDVDTIYEARGLIVGVRLSDRSELIGTQTQKDDLARLLEACGADRNSIEIRR